MSDRRLLTVPQVAHVCQVSPATVRSWIDRGHIRREEDGRIDAAALLRYLDDRGQHGQHARRS